MCIKKVESYEFAGKLFASELAAVEAAINEIGNKLKTDHHANPAKGMIEMRDDIVDMLTRHAILSKQTPEVASDVVDVPWGRDVGDPKVGYRRRIVRWAKDGHHREAHADIFVIDWETWVLNTHHDIREFEEHFANWKD